MQELDDIALLRQYAERHSEEAFAVLVTRHINQVYSVALRHTRNPHQAEEITQAVFVILAGKARSLGRGVILSGWLYHAARLTSVTCVRSEIRRARREQEAHMQSTLDETAMDETWRQITPLLDAAMAHLADKDRNAIVLRFFDGKSMRDVGLAMGATEDAAKKRVNRALDKLQRYFHQRGISSTTTIIAGAISSNSVQAAPVALADSVTAVALAKGAAAGASTLTLVKGVLKIMAWTKMQTAIVVGVVAILAASTTTVVVRRVISSHRQDYYESIFEHPDSSSMSKLDQCPPVLIIRPTRYPNRSGGIWGTHGKCVNDGEPLSELIAWAYGADFTRIILPEGMPDGRYDYLNTLPSGQNDALREAITRQFGLVAKREVRPTDAILLRANDPALLNSFRTKGGNFAAYATGSATVETRYFTNAPLSLLAAQVVEGFWQKPCIDQTDPNARYDFTLQIKFDAIHDSPGAFQTEAEQQIDRLGLELVPTNMPVEMLVVDRTK